MDKIMHKEEFIYGNVYEETSPIVDIPYELSFSQSFDDFSSATQDVETKQKASIIKYVLPILVLIYVVLYLHLKDYTLDDIEIYVLVISSMLLSVLLYLLGDVYNIWSNITYIVATGLSFAYTLFVLLYMKDYLINTKYNKYIMVSAALIFGIISIFFVVVLLPFLYKITKDVYVDE